MFNSPSFFSRNLSKSFLFIFLESFSPFSNSILNSMRLVLIYFKNSSTIFEISLSFIYRCFLIVDNFTSNCLDSKYLI